MKSKLALCIIDMQEGFLGHRRSEPGMASVCEVINHTAGLLRAQGHPVIHIRDVEAADEWTSGDLAILPDIDVREEDLHLEKSHSNAFWETELEAVLRESGAGFVIVCGFAAEHCVLFTYQGAVERGWRAAILQGGILSEHRETVHGTYLLRHIVSYPVVEHIMEQAAAGRI
ncbi:MULTISPECIES: cysteine hydrolase family protein [Paenibacillus]|uniref:cysteine hydrolase family protein n=1 Tax=Paenibacillus TaxID=44249 RepID=UPI0022B8D0DE|nr:isochorismatase family cysteine hydrolase [Paenibacillus caseinilyticus]MCZ8521230.1 cysteine hydrolase [Paenibacillus caseinilyticus]